MVRPIICLFVVAWCIVSCNPAKKQPGLHFTFLNAGESGIDFENDITESDSLNLFVNEYTYMGAGVGVGDFNNDGLPDVFLPATKPAVSYT